MEKIWFEARQSLAEDGFYWTIMPCDRDTGQLIPGTEAQYGARSAWSTMVVRAGLQLTTYVSSLTKENRALAEKTGWSYAGNQVLLSSGRYGETGAIPAV